MKTFIHVGANDGITRDPVYQLIQQGWQGILIEPITHYYHSLKANLQNYKGLYFENVAISSQTDNKEMFYIDPEFHAQNSQLLPDWIGLLGSFNKEHLTKHIQNAEIKSEMVACVPLSSIISKYNIKDLDLLNVDTEGYDDETIMSLDFSELRPKEIWYEHKHLTEDKNNKLLAFLLDRGYVVSSKNEETTKMVNKVIICRNNLPFLLNEKKLNGKGVEIGVRYGEFSEWILKYSKLSLLISIDPWTEYDPGNGTIVSQKDQDDLYNKTIERLKGFGSRSKVIRKSSIEASCDIADGELDFVFIDGDHSYEGCKQDLEAWYPKVKEGGIFAGHDFFDGEFEYGSFGVKSAVTEFSQKYNLIISVINNGHSWVCEKPSRYIKSNLQNTIKKEEKEETKVPNIQKKVEYVVFIVNGGIGKNFNATVPIRGIKQKYPDKKLIVLSGWTDVYKYNPNVYRAITLGKSPFFYDDYISGQKSIVLNTEPYYHQDYIVPKGKHITELWCEQLGVPFDNSKPDMFFSKAEVSGAKRFASLSPKPILFIHAQGGAANMNVKQFVRSLPLEIFATIANAMQTTHRIVQIKYPEQKKIQGAETTDNYDLRDSLSLLLQADKVLCIDSMVQHACASMNKKAVVCWCATNPTLLGYNSNYNLRIQSCPTPECHRPNSFLSDLDANLKAWSCPYGESCTNYIPQDIIKALR